MKARNNFLVLIFCVFLISCKYTPTSLKAYYEWFTNPEHGFVKTREMKGVVYNIYYRPSDLMVAYEIDADKKYSKQQLDSIKGAYNDSAIFVLELIAVGNENLEWNELKDQRYDNLINDLSFNMKDKISVLTSSDTLKPIMYHYERGFELGSKQRFMFVFPKIENTDEVQVVYHDDLFNSSIYKFRFSNIGDYPLLEDVIL